MVRRNRKLAILEKGCSCNTAKQINCDQLWGMQRLDRPWRGADHREESGSPKGMQLREYGPLR
ncbi:UNVERIFIED_CONTAM: hypothetical protein FKN15_061700 [Acipenser sinensis]